MELSESIIRLPTDNENIKDPEIAEMSQRYILHWNYVHQHEGAFPDKLLTKHAKHLIEIYLKENGIASVPKGIGQFLPDLTFLSLAGNELTSECIQGLSELKLLETLDLSQNRIEILLPDWSKLERLKRLDLSDNLIMELSDCLGRLSNLECLKLSRNHLRSFPPSLGQLHSLRSLDLSSNQLSGLPPSLRHCTALSDLRLDKNLFHFLPRFLFTSMHSLKQLNANSNQLLSLPMLPLKPQRRLLFDRNPGLTHVPAIIGSRLDWKFGWSGKKSVISLPDRPFITVNTSNGQELILYFDDDVDTVCVLDDVHGMTFLGPLVPTLLDLTLAATYNLPVKARSRGSLPSSLHSKLSPCGPTSKCCGCHKGVNYGHVTILLTLEGDNDNILASAHFCSTNCAADFARRHQKILLKQNSAIKTIKVCNKMSE